MDLLYTQPNIPSKKDVMWTDHSGYTHVCLNIEAMSVCSSAFCGKFPVTKGGNPMRSQHNPNRQQLPQLFFLLFVHVAIDDVWVIAGLRIQGEEHPTGQRIGQRCFRGHRLFGVGERCVLQGEASFEKETGEFLSNKVPRRRLWRVGTAKGKIEKASFKSKAKIVGFSISFLRTRVFFYRKASEATGDHERSQNNR